MPILEQITGYLSGQPLMVLFLAVFIGFGIGRIRIGGMLVGSVGVIISGMIFGLLGLSIPSIIQTLGVLIFIYAIGVQAGPRIFSIFKKKNLRYLWVAVLIFSIVTVFAFLFSKLMHMDRDMFVGIYCGIFGSAAALGNLINNGGSTDSLLPYSFAYPLSLLLTIMFVNLVVRRYHLESKPRLDMEIDNKVTVRDEKIITEKVLIKSEPPKTLLGGTEDRYGVVIKEMVRGRKTRLPSTDTKLKKGDILLAEGYESDVKKFTRSVGVTAVNRVKHPPGVETRQVLVTNRDVDGKTLRQLRIRKDYGCVVTRIWRSGVLIAAPESWVQVELGDTLMVMGPTQGLEKFIKLVGRHGRVVGEVDFFSLSLIIIIGMVLGQVTIKLPFMGAVKLGTVGATLLLALAIGYVRRVGFIYGQLTPQARNVIKELGLTLFLVGVGTDAGAIFHKFPSQKILTVFSTALVVQLAFLLVVFFIILFYRGRSKAATILSVFCGAITNTVALGVLMEKTGSDEFMIPYASVYPIAQVVLIVLAQLLYVIY